MTIKILEGNETYIRVVGPKDVRDALFEYFSYYVPNYERMPKYKEKDDDGNPKWDGKIHLYSRRTGTIYKGLLNSVRNFLKQNRWEYDIEPEVLPTKVDDASILEVFDSITLPYTPHAWQVKGFFSACRNQRRVFVAATGTGKSLVVYMLARYLPGPTLIIVPTKGLIAQATKDFSEYDPTWNIQDNIQIIKGGLDKEIGFVDIELEDGSSICLLRNDSVKTINRGVVKAKELTTNDHIDDRWLRAHLSTK